MYDVPTQFVRLFEQTDRLDITRELLEDHAPAENMQWIQSAVKKQKQIVFRATLNRLLLSFAVPAVKPV